MSWHHFLKPLYRVWHFKEHTSKIVMETLRSPLVSLFLPLFFLALLLLLFIPLKENQYLTLFVSPFNFSSTRDKQTSIIPQVRTHGFLATYAYKKSFVKKTSSPMIKVRKKNSKFKENFLFNCFYIMNMYDQMFYLTYFVEYWLKVE